MSQFKWILILPLLIITSGYAADNGANWDALTSWIGKAPSTKGGNKLSLLDQPTIKAALKDILPKSEFASLAKFKVEAPVTKVEEFLIVDKCLPHNCPADMATVVIDIKNKRLWVGFFSREEKRVTTRWYGMSDDYSVLPESIKKDFLARHGD